MFDSANNNVNVISPIFYRYSITCFSQVFKLNCKKSVITLYRLHFAQRSFCISNKNSFECMALNIFFFKYIYVSRLNVKCIFF